ncbi:histidinol dehydrogenase [Spelaeicoccus albus]|uniref:Histidinol dehydrogenase n=1 Tax=Spelaeicoccus albus TaxID=1280376 RepID=A0A7Z0AB55_9MICO|nr:histidinol dehydrogenase [Spelaeicoccus albus]NYI66978.1 sulfopropanediol 3-dehydrogenase [Spelaeicoccus albus]
MRIQDSDMHRITGRFTTLKDYAEKYARDGGSSSVVETVTTMLDDIEANGIEAVRRYAKSLDKWESPDFEVSGEQLAHAGDALDTTLREAMRASAERTRAFARAQREHLNDLDFELLPGLQVGHRYVPVASVGAYLPAGQFPILSSAFMSINVAKVAGVSNTIACTPPASDGSANPAVLYAAYLAGADHVFVLGGVQALAGMAYGLLGQPPASMMVGAGNAFVTEAKRQLFGKVGIDLLAGPSEIAVIADDSADPAWVAADLLGQAEHGVQSPASLVTTSQAFGEAVIENIDKQLHTLTTAHIAGPAWRDFGTVYVADGNEAAVELMNLLAPEHLELQTEDDNWFYERLTNYGSIFIGPWSTVAFSDKGQSGTNHTLPTGRGAASSAGLSVARFLKPLTFQRATQQSIAALAPNTAAIAHYEGMAAHQATADIRAMAADVRSNE